MNNDFPKFLLDSGDPEEYKEISELAKTKGSLLWGSTTNPSLIAKKLSGKKISQKEALELQKKIVLEILEIVPGAVSAEVYADENTTTGEMIAQGKEIAPWHTRVVVKLPTTLEGFKARTALRAEGIPVNNTLVFSQEQIFAICLHEQIIKKELQKDAGMWPSFISPFVGRLDDIGLNGMDLVRHGMNMKKTYGYDLWMLEASVRSLTHMQEGIDSKSELITAPAKTYREWFSENASNPQPATNNLKPIPYWTPSEDLVGINTIEDFMSAIESGKLNITHDLTEKGITKFAADWKTIISE